MINITIEKVVNTIGMQVEDWDQNCCDICIKLLQSKLVIGTLKDGYYIGQISAKSSFSVIDKDKPLRHCWIETMDGDIIDPTYWTISGEDPYVFFGNNNGTYVNGETLPYSFYGQ